MLTLAQRRLFDGVGGMAVLAGFPLAHVNDPALRTGSFGLGGQLLMQRRVRGRAGN
ncbi:hypothetical protein [Paraburkholderia azotifigens]|uniref:hypothetical protein n=1 Tax=Paraburkholderia azotifigens TaxID=2057004 RepID=UPI0013158C30|nr:hypothetical protein [Paraburkholderia azotifigens]